MNAAEAFREAIAAAGLTPPEFIKADGELHRFASNGQRGDDAGWYVLHLDGVPGGAFGCWRAGLYQTWCARDRYELTAAERSVQARRIKAARDKRRLDKERRHAECRDRAAAKWAQLPSADPNLGYPARKQIQPHGARQDGDRLVIPVRDVAGTSHGLQFISPDGGKLFMLGTNKTGRFHLIGEPRDVLVVAEGFATAASIHEATGLAVAVAFDKGNLLPVAQVLQGAFPDTRIIIAGDNDRDGGGQAKAKAAAAAVGGVALIPEPIPGKPDPDWNDVVCRVGVDAVAQAFAAPPELEPESWQDAVARLASLPAVEYEMCRKEEAKRLGMRAAVLDRAVNDARCSPPMVTAGGAGNALDREALAASARAIIGSQDVLALFAAEWRKLMAGEERNAKILYLASTSRLFQKTMHVAIKGQSASGKSEIRERVLSFFPPEAIISFTTLSEKALLYYQGEFSHKIMSMGEAAGTEEQSLQDYLIRELMSSNRLRYPVPQKIGNEIITTTIEKEGPVVFVVTTTKHMLHSENETRMLSLETDDSEAQTRAVLSKVAALEGLGEEAESVDFMPWRDYQRWLATGPLEVVIPFAPALAQSIPACAVRLRRDLGQVLRAIKAHALLHRAHRDRDDRGRIVADVERDYAAVRELLADVIAITNDAKLKETTRQTINAVAALTAVMPPEEGATATAVGKKLRLDKSTARRRLIDAQMSGHLKNLETRRGQPGKYRIIEQSADETEMLPTPSALQDALTTGAAPPLPPCQKRN